MYRAFFRKSFNPIPGTVRRSSKANGVLGPSNVAVLPGGGLGGREPDIGGGVSIAQGHIYTHVILGHHRRFAHGRACVW